MPQVALNPEVVTSGSKSKRRLITSDDDDGSDCEAEEKEEEEGEEEDRGHPIRGPGSDTPAVNATGGIVECGGFLTPNEACGDAPKVASTAAAGAATRAAVPSTAETNVSPRAVEAAHASAIAIRAKGGGGGGRGKKRLRVEGADELEGLEGMKGLENGHTEGGGGAAAAALTDLTREGKSSAAASSGDATAPAATTSTAAATGEGNMPGTVNSNSTNSRRRCKDKDR